MKKIVDWIIARARRTPYFHLYHADGSAYMMRYWLVPYTFEKVLTIRESPIGWLLQRFGIAVRLHHICTPDADRAMHDHPWSFLSIVLRGWYLEARPMKVSPCFDGPVEEARCLYRLAGSIGFRHAPDRHRVTQVSDGGVWTLFATGPQRQWWGFYTPAGKIYYRDYESVHNKEAIAERDRHHSLKAADGAAP